MDYARIVSAALARAKTLHAELENMQEEAAWSVEPSVVGGMLLVREAADDLVKIADGILALHRVEAASRRSGSSA